jgi:hypothetical protein
MRADLVFDLDDAPAKGEIAKVGGGNYLSWHLYLRSGGSEVRLDASAVEDIEAIVDQLNHDLALLKQGATR